MTDTSSYSGVGGGSNIYSYNAVGQVATIEQGGSGGVQEKQANFSYNGAGQTTALTTYIGFEGSGTQVATGTYTFGNVATTTLGGAYVGSRDTAIATALGKPEFALATFKSGFRTLIPEVTAEATVGGRVFSDVNPLARLGSVEVPTLIAGRVAAKIATGGRPCPNRSIGTAHAEIGAIQQAADAGVTQGADMVLRVTGARVCGYCRGDVPAAAQAAGLKSLLVIEEATGEQALWTPGTKSLKFQ